MPANVYPSPHPLVAHKLARLRDTQTDPKQFRELVRELAVLLCYEATTDLETEEIEITTPMGKAKGKRLKQGLSLVPVLRAGLGMVEGIWEMLPGAEVWHIGLKRDERTLQPIRYYANPPAQARVQITLVLDPMLATGGSASATCALLKDWGVQRIKYLGLIAAPEGIQKLQTDHPDVPIHIAAIDSHLNDVGYIVPGLGDAGDRQFGTGS